MATSTTLAELLVAGDWGITEAEYLAVGAPGWRDEEEYDLPDEAVVTVLDRLIAFLRGQVAANRCIPNDRLLRLWAVGCVRVGLDYIAIPECRAALGAAEEFADGPNTAEARAKMDAAYGAALRAVNSQNWPPTREHDYSVVAAYCAKDRAKDAARNAARLPEAFDPHPAWPHPAEYLRCVCGNPFRPAPKYDPAWLAWNGGTVRKVAEGIYRERAFRQAHELADALEESGCDDAAILGHLREPAGAYTAPRHCRGCWVFDLVMGRR